MKLDDVGTVVDVGARAYKPVFVDMVIVDNVTKHTLSLWHPTDSKRQWYSKHTQAIRNFMKGKRK